MSLFKIFLLLTFWPTSSKCFFCFPFHCLDSMSELLDRIVSNAFTVSVDKDFGM